ncbi:MAG: Rieske (2Fe-2S) protein [Leptonema sp. (in: bacteria)]
MPYFKIANVREVKENKVISKFTPYGMIGLTKIQEQIIAFQDECTHDGAPFDDAKIELSSFEIICPRHGARFDLKTGKVTRPPAFEPIEIYKVKIENDEIFIEID